MRRRHRTTDTRSPIVSQSPEGPTGLCDTTMSSPNTEKSDVSQSPEGSTGLCDLTEEDCKEIRSEFSVSIPRRVDRSLRRAVASIVVESKKNCLNPPKGRPVFATHFPIGCAFVTISRCLNPPKGRPVFATPKVDGGPLLECLNPPKGRPVFATRKAHDGDIGARNCLNPPKGRPVFATVVVVFWLLITAFVCLNPPKGRPAFATS